MFVEPTPDRPLCRGRRAAGSRTANNGPSGGGDYWSRKPCVSKKPLLAIRDHEFGRPKGRSKTGKGAKQARIEPAKKPSSHQQAAAVLEENTKTCGPAQCKVDNVRFGGEKHADSYTTGWGFLVAADADDARGSRCRAAAAVIDRHRAAHID